MILRFEIIDVKTSICLYERIWKWSEERKTSGICSLISSFYMFANTIEAGDISFADFESQGRGAKNEGIRVTCRKIENIILAVFHNLNVNADGVSEFLQRSGSEFIELYSGKVNSLRALLEKLASDELFEDEEDTPDTIKDKFVDFDDFINSLLNNILPNNDNNNNNNNKNDKKKEDFISEETITESDKTQEKKEKKQ